MRRGARWVVTGLLLAALCGCAWLCGRADKPTPPAAPREGVSPVYAASMVGSDVVRLLAVRSWKDPGLEQKEAEYMAKIRRCCAVLGIAPEFGGDILSDYETRIESQWGPECGAAYRLGVGLFLAQPLVTARGRRGVDREIVVYTARLRRDLKALGLDKKFGPPLASVMANEKASTPAVIRGLKEISAAIDRDLKTCDIRRTLAVLPVFGAGGERSDITDRLDHLFTNTPVWRTVERRRLRAALAEAGLQAQAIFDGRSAVKLGQLVGARYLVFGRVRRRPSGQYCLVVPLISTQTGVRLASGMLESPTPDFPTAQLKALVQFLSESALAR